MRTPTHSTLRFSAVVAVTCLSLAGLSACSSSSSSNQAASTAAGCPLTVTDAWVKAADKGMTAAFGTLTNNSGAAADVVSASTPDSSSMELHEVADDDGSMVMQPVPGGLTIPGNGTLTLEPGGYHLMLMDVTTPIKAGDKVPVTLTCADGATVDFTAQAREYQGGDEEYKNEGMADTDMSSEPSPMSS